MSVVGPNAKITERAARTWTRWAGLGNGRIGALFDRVGEVCSGVGIGEFRSDKGTVSTRVRRIRCGAQPGVEVLPDDVEALWCPTDGPRARVTVLLELEQQLMSGEGIELRLGELTLVGTLDGSPRPRAVDTANVELDSGVVLRTGGELATLLMRKSDVAVLSILARWPPPNDLPHGQNAREIAASP